MHTTNKGKIALRQTWSITAKSIPILFLLACPTSLLAQFPSDYKDKTSTNSQQQKTTEEVDTLSPDVYYFYLKNPAKTTLLQDKDLHNFHIFNPTRQAEYEHQNLGNLGSAAKSVVYQPQFHKGFNAGFHSFDLYYIAQKDIRFYQLEKVYSDIAFSQGATQEQTNFTGKFSKNLSSTINFAIDYKRINNNGQYRNQRNRNTSFSLNSWYVSPSKHYQAFASYTTNTVQQLENGGVTIANPTGELRDDILSIARPINTGSAEARYFQRELSYAQYYSLNKKKNASHNNVPQDSISRDSTPGIKQQIRPSKKNIQQQRPWIPKAQTSTITTPPQATSTEDRQYTLFHQLIVRRNTYKYSDADQDAFTRLYQNFQFDDRGLRHFADIREYENSFSIRTFQTKRAASLLGKSSGESSNTKDLLEVGITHTFTDINRRLADSTANNLFLYGNIQYTPSKRFTLKSYAHFGLFGQSGDYYIKGDAELEVPKIGRLAVGIIAQHYAPSLLQRELLITQQRIWNNRFENKTFENSLYASYYFPALRLRLKGQFHVLSNYIYFDENAFPQQTTDEITVSQLILENNLNWKGISLENTVYYQKTSQQYLRLPEWYSRHRISYTNTLFNKTMHYQVGAQLRLHPPYSMDGFQPLIAQFHLQNQQENTLYPNLDAFININIADFRFFINAQNLADYFRTDFYYPFYQYPLFDSTIRFGFRWMFLD